MLPDNTTPANTIMYSHPHAPFIEIYSYTPYRNVPIYTLSKYTHIPPPPLGLAQRICGEVRVYLVYSIYTLSILYLYSIFMHIPTYDQSYNFTYSHANTHPPPVFNIPHHSQQYTQSIHPFNTPKPHTPSHAPAPSFTTKSGGAWSCVGASMTARGAAMPTPTAPLLVSVCIYMYLCYVFVSVYV